MSGYRDYVAYGGVSDDGMKLFAVVVQLGRRKAMLRKPVGAGWGQPARFSVVWRRLAATADAGHL